MRICLPRDRTPRPGSRTGTPGLMRTQRPWRGGSVPALVRATGRAIYKDAHAYTWSGSGDTSTQGRQRTGSYSVRRLALVYMTPGGGVAVSQALS